MTKTVYQVGDRVIPADLPRPLLCRVQAADDVALGPGETGQILTLEPLDGPWERGVTLVRLDSAVRPAGTSRTARRGDTRGVAAAC